MGDTKFVYTLSSRGDLVKQAIHSIKTLTQYVDPADIHVIYTPPRTESDLHSLESLGVEVQISAQLTDEFSIVTFDSGGAYAEKVRCCDVDAETVVFLDCDTLVLNDIWEVIKGEFDFKARPSPETPTETKWKQLFDRFGQPYLNFMPNAGFLIFKNGVHKEIRDVWLEYINSDLDHHFSGASYTDQWSLALAISEYNCETMTRNEHAIEWSDGCVANATVHHLYTQKGVSLHDAVTSPVDMTRQFLRSRDLF